MQKLFFRTSLAHVQASKIESSVFTKCPLTDKWMSNVQYIHSMEYYLALKRQEILKHVTTRMNPEDMILSEIRQSQNAAWFHLREVPRVVKFTEAESRTELPRGCREWGPGNDYFMGMKCELEKMKKCWRRVR